MTAIKLEGFSGLIPRVSKRLLPNMSATIARNTKLLSGEGRGFNTPRVIGDFTAEYLTVRRAYRIPANDDYDDTWLLFDSRDVDIVRSPLLNDAYDRYYWAGDGQPKYNTLQRIRAGQSEYYLGIPTPVDAPTVTPPGGSSGTRAYVYTFVSAYGEEGAPSPPTLADGDPGTWVISDMDTTVPDSSNRAITRKRIYRTVPGNSSSLFFFVAEVALGDASYNDNETDDTVAANTPLESASWIGPPTDLEGFVAMPNGYLVGWVGRRLVFSEPYRPHAWPAEYELSTEFEIVGLAVWGANLIIGTRSQPYIGQGQTPSAFTMQKMDAIEPCLSRRGMASTVAGVYYPSVNGLVLANSQGTTIVTQDLMTKEEWATYNPGDLYAATLGLQYIAFNSPSFGIIFNPSETAGRFVELDRFNDVLGIETDRYNGTVYLLMQDRAWEWDPVGSERLFWRWRSKEYHFPKPVNFGAVKIKMDLNDINVSADVTAYYRPYNEARFAAGTLNTLNGHALLGVQGAGQVPNWTEPETRMPLAGSPLYPINLMLAQLPAVRFIAYCNGVKKFDRVVRVDTMIRMPAGFKGDVWQFEMIGNTTMYSVQIAETGKELATT